MLSSAAKISVDLLVALGKSESVEMNGKIDCQAQQTWHLVCSLSGQRCLEAWGTLWAWTSQSITALIVWRKEEWSKEAADIPPSEVWNDMCSPRQTLAPLRGQLWVECWETGRSAYGPFLVLRCHLEQRVNWTEVLSLSLSLSLPSLSLCLSVCLSVSLSLSLFHSILSLPPPPSVSQTHAHLCTDVPANLNTFSEQLAHSPCTVKTH